MTKYEKKVNASFSFFMRKFKYEEMIYMFSDELLERIFCDERMKDIPLCIQSTVVHVVEDALENRYYTENVYMTKEDILNDVCNKG